MSVQQEIAEAINAQKVGRIFKEVLDRRDGDYYVKRTEFDTINVDGEVLVLKSDNQDVKVGILYQVKIENEENIPKIVQCNIY